MAAKPSKRRKKAPKPPSTVWLNRGWQPVYIGFCPSERAWNSEMKRLHVKGSPYPTKDACATTFYNEGENKRTVMITVNERLDKKQKADPAGLAALMAHEAVHAWQTVKEHTGETDPGREMEAYAVQAIFGSVYEAYLSTRAKKR